MIADYRLSQWYSRSKILLIYVPLFNFLFFSLAMSNLGVYSLGLAMGLSLHMWSSALICLLFAKFLEVFTQIDSDSVKMFISKYCLCATVGGTTSFILLNSFDLPLVPEPLSARTPMGPVMFSYVEVLLFAALKYILQQQQQHMELNANYKEAQFRALKAQLNPHMLFNSLNLISSEIEHNPANASLLLDELSELLRGVLRSSNQLLLPLAQEIELTRHYLVIQKMRFEERLEYELNIAPDCLQVQVPGLMLQPFIENCIVHGFASKKEPGVIQVDIAQEDKCLHVTVKDNGIGFNTQGKVYGHGVGIVRDTLELLYGSRHQLEIESQPGLGTSIEIQLPVNPVNPVAGGSD
ncbi:sensor histidine kinase [Thalassomonas viridans]|nr:histidine kinase [Thalassomonas viridans]